MKRFHVHAHVQDLQASIAFYSRMFAAEPTRVEPDYAKWMLDDPRINFAISTRGTAPGVDHLGIQVDTEEEFAEMKARAEAASLTLLDVGEANCCYARSDKYWVVDPQGLAWEQFRTLDSIPVHAGARPVEPRATGCCAGAAPRGKPVPVLVADASPASCC